MRRPLLVGFLLPVLAGVLCAAGADKVEETVESLYGAELRAVAATPDPADDLALAGRVFGRSGVHVTRGEDGRPILRFGPKQGFGALAWSPDGRDPRRPRNTLALADAGQVRVG